MSKKNIAVKGTLYVVATPIGNLEDMTLRAIRILREVKLIAAEDTRRTGQLLKAHGVATPMISLYDANEASRSGYLTSRIEEGIDIAYVSDAGTPGISDPGYLLVNEAIKRGIRIVPVPGASAVVAALSVSGLPMDSFLFSGFLPSKSGKRRSFFSVMIDEPRTMVFYESPKRLLSTLRDLAEMMGNREIVIARELTKVFEEFLRGPVEEVMGALAGRAIKGEITLIVAGRKAPPPSDEEIRRRIAQLRKKAALSPRDMASRIALELGIPRGRVYREIIESEKE
jgi:16S rRNA (cytidine1402-2'-O)-methyltransferase